MKTALKLISILCLLSSSQTLWALGSETQPEPAAVEATEPAQDIYADPSLDPNMKNEDENSSLDLGFQQNPPVPLMSSERYPSSN
jgi:hypothetical protein